MKTWMTASAAAFATLAGAGPLQAHHSGSMYDSTPVRVKGTVVRFENVDPHTVTTVEERSEDGQVRLWGVEGPGRSQLDRMAIGLDPPEAGDDIEVCAFPYKSPEELSRIFPGTDFSALRASSAAGASSPRFVSGHVMTMPDGEKRIWNPHGVISECIRSSNDDTQSWLDFLDASARARQAWCQQRGLAHDQSTASLQAFVEDINDAMDDPCE